MMFLYMVNEILILIFNIYLGQHLRKHQSVASESKSPPLQGHS